MDLANLTLHELAGSLEAFEKRISRSSEGSFEQAFQAKMNIREGKSKKSRREASKGNFQQRSPFERGSSSFRGKNYSRGRGYGRGRGISFFNSRERSNTQCFIWASSRRL